MRRRLHWFAQQGFIRRVALLEAGRGDPQARLIADPAVAADPMSFYDELRAVGPLVRGRAGYVAVGHAVASELLRSDDFRVRSIGSDLPAPMRWLEARTRDDLLHPLRPPSMLVVDGPDHTRYRKAVSTVFTPKAVAKLRDRVDETASALLDKLADQSGAVDIVGRYCMQLPVAVISDMLGVPDRDRDHIMEYGELATRGLDLDMSWRQYRNAQRGLAGFNTWLAGHLEQLRRGPGDDLMSQLIQEAESGPPDTHLNRREVEAIAGLVLGAGFGNSVTLLSEGIRMLTEAPEHLQTLNQRPQLWPNAVEEMLRLQSPVQFVPRLAGKDVEIAGTVIKRGTLVIVYVAAANRDPSVFVDPHRFDIERSNAGRHLAFSGGRHFCLGAALTRAEGEIGLRKFFDRFPDARAAGAGSRRDSKVLRGWLSLPVTLRPGA